MPLETAYDKLAAKWQGYFERSRDETDEADEADEATPLPAQGKRRSLFRKIRKASRSQVRRPLDISHLFTAMSAISPWPQYGLLSEGEESLRPHACAAFCELGKHACSARRSTWEHPTPIVGKSASKEWASYSGAAGWPGHC